MLTTLLPIDAGRATIAGFDVRTRPKDVRCRIGYVSQLGGADDLATGRENLVLQGRLYGGQPADVVHRAEHVMQVLDLTEFADRKVNSYSGGQRRRLDVALGIVHEPDVLFLDEPTTGLDPQNRANLWDQIRLLRERGTTVFLTTHYLEEADALCDRIMIMDHGRIVADGTPQELKRRVAADTIVVAIRDAQRVEHALTVLAEQPYVREASAHEENIRLYVDDGSTALPEVLRLLDREQVGLRNMTLSEPTLDDVFLRQTGRSLRDAGAANHDPTAEETGDKEVAA
jgi:ABC-2 type transport system ATP-binding protein